MLLRVLFVLLVLAIIALFAWWYDHDTQQDNHEHTTEN